MKMRAIYQRIAGRQRIEILCIGFSTISGKLNQGMSSGQYTPHVWQSVFFACRKIL
jgi:hypothetical protein